MSDMFFINDVICRKCRSQMKVINKNVKREDCRLRCFYQYDGLVREMIIQFKELYDEALFPLFLWPFYEKLKKRYRDYVIVPVPSFPKRHEKRGFHAVKKMYSLLELPVYDVLVKEKDVSQKKSGFKKRKEIGKHLSIKPDHGLKDKKVLLVDDICTSGATMAACHKLLKGQCRKIRVMAIAVTPKSVSNR